MMRPEGMAWDCLVVASKGTSTMYQSTDVLIRPSLEELARVRIGQTVKCRVGVDAGE